MRLAWAIERRLTKDEILEAYVNLVSFRGEITGVAAAAEMLLGKAPHGITAAEGAVLAALVRSPEASPAVVERRAVRVAAATNEGVTREMVARAVSQALGSRSPVAGANLAPHVGQRLLRGQRAGVVVPSTLDGGVQREATAVIRAHLLALAGRGVRDAALLAVDNASGDVLAYVGSADDLASARHVDGVQARRQAGSSLKPFLYALLFEQRLLTPASLLDDSPLEVPVTGGLYRPRNYDDQFRGLVTARVALGSSLNVPAVRALGLVGAEAFTLELRRLGFRGLDEDGDYYGPALALGAADVSLWDLVGAYRALARGGLWGPLRLAPEAPSAGPEQRVYSPGAAFLVSDALADRESRSVTFGLDSALATRYWTAVKTGTSRDMRDNWCVGYSSRYTVGVWVGNFPGQPMRDVSGVAGAAPIWREVMDWLHRDTASHPPAVPPGLVRTRGGHVLSGTEPVPPVADSTALAIRAPVARIASPARHTIVAVDPDIPSDRQRLVFEAEGATDRLAWRLGAEDLGPARQIVTWRPTPGRHTLTLVDPEGRVVDAVKLEVRAPRSPS
jgi:penicillin-binding protein 1C